VDDITDPIAVLIAEVRAARENLQQLLNRMQTERRYLESRLESLSRSSRLTESQRQRLFKALQKARRRM
jgi:hypothetical protein